MDSGSSHPGGRPAVLRTRRHRVLDLAVARALRLPAGHHDHTLVRDVRVPMRDGVELLTDVYSPVGPSSGTLLLRTPYGRTGSVTLLTARYHATHGYLVVHQSCRGTAGSGGDFEPFSREVEDGADTVGWLREQPWFDGRFALCGPSYLGFTAWAIMVDPPPELAAAVVAVAAHDNHQVVHQGGAFSLEAVLGLAESFDHLDDGTLGGILRLLTQRRRLRPGFEELPLVRIQDTLLRGSRAPFRAWLTATDPDDPVWRSVRLGRALDRVDVPVLLQEGWQDRFGEQMIEQYQRLRQRGVDVGLTIGPWTHVEFVHQGSGVAMAEALDWLAEHLGGAGNRHRPSPVRVFVTGAGEWRSLPAWPPATEEHVLHLQPGGGLAVDAPPPGSPPSTFVYDPADPTPAVGGRVINPQRGGYRDNRGLETRADVLTFTGSPLAAPLEVVGTPVVELVHRTDNPHADLFVRLCEVTADGRSTNLTDGFRRLGPDEAGAATVRLRFEAVAHRFAPGTRIRLQVSGGAHPRFARNLGTDDDPATGTTLAPSHRAVHHGDGGCSRLVLPCTAGPRVPPGPPPPTPAVVSAPRAEGAPTTPGV
ncbi:hypothetical protein SAMN04488543_2705 [Friedmanniella luteola]|uniref:Xaa-Pro dipeptidyl-peptidase C-terminal domain-containing protein n=1 Tax=Friedmanniella luteola TaxID=546871 RepID=A0A1H1WDL0_9ACTN|nr:CocE/NonD family hydrolase [Friedmanniella luteola]SDS95213.1 hypothetical protein SAMN04488543_2705 [Friedmanniella luteola]